MREIESIKTVVGRYGEFVLFEDGSIAFHFYVNGDFVKAESNWKQRAIEEFSSTISKLDKTIQDELWHKNVTP